MRGLRPAPFPPRLDTSLAELRRRSAIWREGQPRTGKLYLLCYRAEQRKTAKCLIEKVTEAGTNSSKFGLPDREGGKGDPQQYSGPHRA
jgi:hypothetical protein